MLRVRGSKSFCNHQKISHFSEFFFFLIIIKKESFSSPLILIDKKFKFLIITFWLSRAFLSRGNWAWEIENCIFIQTCYAIHYKLSKKKEGRRKVWGGFCCITNCMFLCSNNFHRLDIFSYVEVEQKKLRG